MNVNEMNLLEAADMALADVPVGDTTWPLIQLSLQYRAKGKTHSAPVVWLDAGTAQTLALQLLDMEARARTGGKTPTAN